MRKAALAKLLRGSAVGLEFNEHIEAEDAGSVFAHACRPGFEGIVSKHKGPRYQSGRTLNWLKMKNPDAPDWS